MTTTVWIPKGRAAKNSVAHRSEVVCTLLVVDGLHGIRRFVCRAIELRGYAACSAASVAEARTILRSTAIDLLLIDVDPTLVTGVELASSILTEWPDLPIIFMSGTPVPHELGANGRPISFLQKPFTIWELWEQIGPLLEG